MMKKNYQFRLPEVQYLATHQSAFGDTWMEGQKLPVYAFIPACSDSPSSGTTSGYASPELECYTDINDPGEMNY
jgi:hypothetical protein